jgi:hypothetical protein
LSSDSIAPFAGVPVPSTCPTPPTYRPLRRYPSPPSSFSPSFVTVSPQSRSLAASARRERMTVLTGAIFRDVSRFRNEPLSKSLQRMRHKRISAKFIQSRAPYETDNEIRPSGSFITLALMGWAILKVLITSLYWIR